MDEIEAQVGRQAVDQLDLEALEMAVRQQALQLAARAVEQRLNADTFDYAGPRLSCRCGGEARYAGRRSKHFHSALGSLHLQRAYYHCGFCRERTEFRLTRVGDGDSSYGHQATVRLLSVEHKTCSEPDAKRN